MTGPERDSAPDRGAEGGASVAAGSKDITTVALARAMTAAAHRAIYDEAAALLDVAEHLPDGVADAARAIQRAEMEAGPLMHQVALVVAATSGHGTLSEYLAGPDLTVQRCALSYALFGRHATPMRWCEHRTGLLDPRPALLSAALRFAGCGTCVESPAHNATLAHDTQCDVCGADHGVVRERVTPIGQHLAIVATGPCCDELLDYVEPVAVTTYARVGRNDPCPCGAGKKFKKCHGSVAT